MLMLQLRFCIFFLTSRLTAFVMRVFCEAQQFAGVNIDENLVCESVNWLLQTQRGDGSIPEVHAVAHREMVVRFYIHRLPLFLENSKCS